MLLNFALKQSTQTTLGEKVAMVSTDQSKHLIRVSIELLNNSDLIQRITIRQEDGLQEVYTCDVSDKLISTLDFANREEVILQDIHHTDDKQFMIFLITVDSKFTSFTLSKDTKIKYQLKLVFS